MPEGSGPRAACWHRALPGAEIDLGAAAGVPGGPVQDLGDVVAGVVVGEDRGLHGGGGAVGLEEAGGGGDGVAGVVDIHEAVVVAVDAVPAGVLGGGVNWCAAPGVPGCAADAELHRPGRAEGAGARVHAGRGGLAVAAFDGADPGQHRPRDAVLGPGFLVVGEVGRGDGRGGAGGGGLGCARGGLLPGHAGDAADERGEQQDHHGGADGDADRGRAAVSGRGLHDARPFLSCCRRWRARCPRPSSRCRAG